MTRKYHTRQYEPREASVRVRVRGGGRDGGGGGGGGGGGFGQRARMARMAPLVARVSWLPVSFRGVARVTRG